MFTTNPHESRSHLYRSDLIHSNDATKQSSLVDLSIQSSWVTSTTTIHTAHELLLLLLCKFNLIFSKFTDFVFCYYWRNNLIFVLKWKASISFTSTMFLWAFVIDSYLSNLVDEYNSYSTLASCIMTPFFLEIIELEGFLYNKCTQPVRWNAKVKSMKLHSLTLFITSSFSLVSIDFVLHICRIDGHICF